MIFGNDFKERKLQVTIQYYFSSTIIPHSYSAPVNESTLFGALQFKSCYSSNRNTSCHTMPSVLVLHVRFIQIQLDSDWAVSILENKCSIGFQRVHWGGYSWFVWWWWWVPNGSSEYQWQPVGASGFQWVLMCTNLSQWVPVGASGFSGYQCNHGLLDLLGLLVVLPPWAAEPHWPLSTTSMASWCWEI